MRLKNKVAIVTGAGEGIGRAISVEFAHQGAKVVIATRTLEHGRETLRLAKKLGEASFVQVDVAKATDAALTVKSAIENFGHLNILVNNAGVEGRLCELVDLEPDEWDYVLDINLKGAWLCAKYAIPVMTEAGGGSIINVASTFAHIGAPNWGPYCVSKSGMLGLTKVLALECAKRNIRVNALCPGQTITPMYHRMFDKPGGDVERETHLRRHPIGRFGRVEEVAMAAVYLACDESTFTTGSSMFIDGGYLAI